MSQLTQLTLSDETHHNQRLFSDYYLNHILPEHWHSLRAEAIDVMQQLQQLHAKFTPNPNNEAQTEDDWIKPVFQTLGHIFEVQVPLKVPDSVQEPDYIFYRDENARIANKGTITTEENLKQGAYAVGDAKRWERSLDKAVKGGDTFNNKNPSYQIFFYMLHSGLPWGILTNGRHWRLYHEQTAHKLEIFYEVDLPALLLKSDVDSFLYFYTFFRHAAFEQGTLSLDSLLAASTDYAQNVSESLRQQVYDALRSVAQGFLEYPGNNLPATPDTYKAIYDNSLILLYRLLFIFYAEARNLLPLEDNPSYRKKYSLYAIKYSVKNELSEGLLIPTSGLYWTRLKDLFRAIDKGSPPLSVTTFNGGLFDPTKHDFLERYSVGDVSLCRAIDKLARVNGQFVDYRDLAERHLGTIYEGLLEYTLQVATEPMVEVRSSSKIVPAQGVPKREIAAAFSTGEAYLVTDSGERKTTGSYYTPDYIVKYMVEQTLRPLLDNAVQATQSDADRINAVLAINVLDPSMGSGHFPVEVTEYIARYLVALGIQSEDSDEGDLTYWKRRVAQQCIYGVDLNPLAVELAKLSLWLVTVAKDRPLNFLDHHLRAGNTLIGSWLDDIAADQHPKLRQGQKRAKQAEQAATQAGQLAFTLYDDSFRQSTQSALGSIAAIERNPGNTVKDVKAQEVAYAELRTRFSEKYLYLANLGAALYYDLKLGGDIWRPLAHYALDSTLAESMQQQQQQFDTWLDAANALAAKKRFLHWELEFPDIFFDNKGQPLAERAGFDVVIGNPPYVRQEQLSNDKPYYQERYEVYHGVADLFVYFFAQGLRLLKNGGKLAYISSNTWLYANYGTPLRNHLRTQTTLETIIDLGNTKVFADAPDLSPAIQVVNKIPPTEKSTIQAAVFVKGEQITAFREQLGDRLFPVSIHDQPDTGWQLTTNASRILLTKLVDKGKPLGEVVDKQMYRGVLTGLNEAFIIDQTTRDRLVKEDPNCVKLIKPVLRGEDLRPWYQENEGRWLICLPNRWTMEVLSLTISAEDQAWALFSNRYPSLASHLAPFAEAGRKRQDKGQFWWELRPCDYYDAFEQAKIVFPDITKKPRFSWGAPGIYLGNTAYCIPTQSYSLLGILSSRILWFVLSRISQPLGERAGSLIYRLFRQYMERLPIPTLTPTQREQIGTLAQQITDVAQRRYQVRHRTASRIVHDLGNGPDARLNQRLDLWWDLSFPEFHTEITKVFKRTIPLKERDDWEELLRERSKQIHDLTDEIIRLETLLNEQVYNVFDLNEEEIALIERETKYKYGEW
ncbi:MAG: hypothetical protein NVS4B11_36980 [Ktedonobacteraceae bacterium]